jgi:hypothetical protein
MSWRRRREKGVGLGVKESQELVEAGREWSGSLGTLIVCGLTM